MKDSYNYVFHYNDYMTGPDKWCCFHRDDYASYWGGSAGKYVTFTSGSTPSEAWQKMIKLNEQAT